MSFDIDDSKPKTKVNCQFPRLLDDMSVEDLKEYIADMQAEIARVEENIKKKEASKSAADAFFS